MQETLKKLDPRGFVGVDGSQGQDRAFVEVQQGLVREHKHRAACPQHPDLLARA